ncbi:unnamed protein product, partial [marine sediment metagenome]
DSDRQILSNARIYTMDDQEPMVSALVIECGKIIRSGDQETIISQYQDSSTLH